MCLVNDLDILYQLQAAETRLCELQLTWKPSTSHLSLVLMQGSWGPSAAQLATISNIAVQGQWLAEEVDEDDGDTGDPDFLLPPDDDAEIADQIERLLLSSD